MSRIPKPEPKWASTHLMPAPRPKPKPAPEPDEPSGGLPHIYYRDLYFVVGCLIAFPPFICFWIFGLYDIGLLP